MLWKKTTLLLLLVGLIGCASRPYHVINESDIHFMKAGESYTAPKDGLFVTKDYAREVVRVKVNG